MRNGPLRTFHNRLDHSGEVCLKYPSGPFDTIEKGLNMSDPLKPEPKPDELTQKTEPEAIQLTEKEAEDISAGAVNAFLQIDDVR